MGEAKVLDLARASGRCDEGTIAKGAVIHTLMQLRLVSRYVRGYVLCAQMNTGFLRNIAHDLDNPSTSLDILALLYVISLFS